ncbi:MAG: sortase [Candidatus Nanopelagicales bacterium]
MTAIRARALTVAGAALLITGAVTFTVATMQIRQAEASVSSVALPPLAPLSALRAPSGLPPASVSDAATLLARPHMGRAFGAIWLPSLHQRWAIVQGTRMSDLRLGVGHVVGTAMPGATSNTVLAGHRETVFDKLGRLAIGDRVVVRTDDGRFTYRVTGTRIVKPTAVSVLAPTKTAVLTMITCYPFVHYGPSPQRYIVTARLVTSELSAVAK